MDFLILRINGCLDCFCNTIHIHHVVDGSLDSVAIRSKCEPCIQCVQCRFGQICQLYGVTDGFIFRLFLGQYSLFLDGSAIFRRFLVQIQDLFLDVFLENRTFRRVMFGHVYQESNLPGYFQSIFRPICVLFLD